MIDTPQPMSRTFEIREWEVPIKDGDLHPAKRTIWMIDSSRHAEDGVRSSTELRTPLLTVHSADNFDAAALASGILSILTNFGLPDSENPRQFVEVPKTDADKSITGR